MTTAVHNHDDKLIGRWLTVCAVTIFGMILLGGYPPYGVGSLHGRLASHYGSDAALID